LTILFLFASIFSHEGEVVESAEPNALRYFLDISSWQSTFNAQTAKNNGVAGVMCRAGYATSKDRCWSAFTTSAHNAGLNLGAYLFATYHYASVSGTYNDALTHARSQANFFVSVLKTASINTYVALDLEMESGQSTKLNAAQLTEAANVFLDVVKSAGYNPVLYANGDWIFNRLNQANIRYPIWCAYYFRYGTAMDFTMWDGSFPNTTYGNKMKSIKDRIKMWQFTSEGFGGKYGVGSSNLDKNYAYF